MDNDAKLRLLRSLASSETDAARLAIANAIEVAAVALRDSNEYADLEFNLEVLKSIGYRFSDRSVDAIAKFTSEVVRRSIVDSTIESTLLQHFGKYRNANSLIEKALDAAGALRYFQVDRVLTLFLQFSEDTNEALRSKAMDGLRALSEFDIEAFEAMGAMPQTVVVHRIARMGADEFIAKLDAALLLLGNVLSTTMHGHRFSYDKVTISRTHVPAVSDIAAVRESAIERLAEALGSANSVSQKLAILNTLNSACRRGVPAGLDAELDALLVRDSTRVLNVYEGLVSREPLQIVQKIESMAFWTYFHADHDDVRAAALAVKRAIDGNSEYAVYRDLIGFEGVFGDWEEQRNSRARFSELESLRRGRADAYVEEVSARTANSWRDRLVRFATTESDDLATFPVFYYFLEQLAIRKPEFAADLVERDAESLERFLIPLLRGLWAGNLRPRISALINVWISRADQTKGRFLYASTKLFIANEAIDLALVERLVGSAIKRTDLQVARQLLVVATTSLPALGRAAIERIFLPTIEFLTANRDTRWVHESWYRSETDALLDVLTLPEVEVVLHNLRAAERIDYQEEQVLVPLARRYPEPVLMLLIDRITDSRRSTARLPERFDAVPFRFHALNEVLSAHADLVIRDLRMTYRTADDIARDELARLCQAIYPEFPPTLESELVQLAESATTDVDLRFVISVLRAYDGPASIHGVARAVAKRLSAESTLIGELQIALLNTGVVSGEFGLAEAYETRKEQLLTWQTDANERVRKFAEDLVEQLDQYSAFERKRAEESVALRKHRYGES